MRKVLLAIDGSLSSNAAASLLAHLPHHEAWELTITTVIQPPFSRERSATTESLRWSLQDVEQQASRALDDAAAMFDGAAVTITKEIREGNIGEQICRAAQTQASELVVIGATGRSQISRVLLGSVSDHVATHAPCSVLVVREPVAGFEDRPIRIGLAYEATGPAQAAVEEICEIPWCGGTEMHLVSVASYAVGAYGEIIRDSDGIKQHEIDLEKTDAFLSEAIPHRHRHLIEASHRGEALVNFTQSENLDLIVLGETPRSAFTRFLLGSTSRYVLRHAGCSVWLTRNHAIAGTKPRTDATLAQSQ